MDRRREGSDLWIDGVHYTAKIFARHSADCKKGTHCLCWKVLLVYDSVTKKQRQVATHVRSLAEAEKERDKWLDQFDPIAKKAASETMTIEKAIAAYVADMKSRGLKIERKTTMWGNGKERKGSFVTFIDTLTPRPLHISDISVAHLDSYRTSWKTFKSDLSTNSALTDVKTFFKFCKSRGWIQADPAAELKRPKVAKGSRTTIFTDEEYAKILAAAKGDRRLETFLELMRWSGMSLTDAVLFTPSTIKGDVLTYRRVKTKTIATPVLQPHVLALLRSVPLDQDSVGPDQPFRTKDIEAESDANKWWRRLKDLFAAAGVTEVLTDIRTRESHPHMLRDTYAVGLIRSGVPLLNVARAMGHSDTKITERHYLPWVLEMQEAHIEAMRAALPGQLPKRAAGRVVPMQKLA